MHKGGVIIALIIVLFFAILSFFPINNRSKQRSEEDAKTTQNYSVSPIPTPAHTWVTIPLFAENGSGLNGTAVIAKAPTEEAALDVEITLDNALPDTRYPAHLHTGNCDAPGAILYPLNDVVEGKSSTRLTISIGEFKKNLPLIINIHQSIKNLMTYVVCGKVQQVYPTKYPLEK